MYKLIIAYEHSETWHVENFTTWEGAVSARNRFLKAQRLAEVNERADKLQGRKRPRQMRGIRWTAIASVTSSHRE